MKMSLASFERQFAPLILEILKINIKGIDFVVTCMLYFLSGILEIKAISSVFTSTFNLHKYTN